MRLGLKGLRRRFRRDARGVAAIEFALLGPIQLAILLSMLEMSFVGIRIILMENAITNVSKMIYTGAAAGGSVTRDDLKDHICGQLGPFGWDCLENLTLEVDTVDSLSGGPASDATCRDKTLDIDPVVSFNAGTRNQTMMVRACLTTDVIIPGMGLGLSLSKTSTDRYQIVASTVFVNEPF